MSTLPKIGELVMSPHEKYKEGGVAKFDQLDLEEGLRVNQEDKPSLFYFFNGDNPASPLVKFTETTVIPYEKQLVTSLVDVDETFSPTTQVDLYTFGAVGSATLNTGSCTVTHNASQQSTIVSLTGTGVPFPQMWLEANVNVVSGSTGYEVTGVCLALNSNDMIIASVDRVSNEVRLMVRVGGIHNFVAPVTMTVQSNFKIALSMVSNELAIWLNEGSGWALATSSNIASLYDVRGLGALDGYKASMFVSSDSTVEVQFSELKMGRYGGVGIRDQSYVTNKDGTLFQPEEGWGYFTATVVSNTGAGSSAIFKQNMDDYTFEQRGSLYIQRDGLNYGDVANHLSLDDNGDYNFVTSTWGNGFGNELVIRHAVLPASILEGSTLITNTTLLTISDVPVEGGVYDPYLTYDIIADRWLLAYSFTEDTSFSTDMFYARASYSEDLINWTTLEPDYIVRAEGTKIVNCLGNQFVLAGGSTNAYAWDTSMNYLGILDIILDGGGVTQPHTSCVFYKGKYVMNSFNKEYDYSSFTWGDLVMYEGQVTIEQVTSPNPSTPYRIVADLTEEV